MTRAAEWVKGARRSAGLTQRELAVRSGIPQPTIARIESGHQMPRADTLDRLLRACGWELDMTLRRGEGEDRSLIRSWLSLSLPERAERGAAYGRFVTSSAFDPLEALRVLDDSGVAFVVIGRYAAELLGAPIRTNNLDVCPELSRDNLDRLGIALGRLGARRLGATPREDLSTVPDGQTLSDGDAFSFITDFGSLDVCSTPWGTCGFQDLSAWAAPLRLADDLQVLVVDLADLVRMKRASVRIRDKMYLEVLAALREMLDEAEPPPAT